MRNKNITGFSGANTVLVNKCCLNNVFDEILYIYKHFSSFSAVIYRIEEYKTIFYYKNYFVSK